MRFLCFVAILFFLFLNNSDGALQAECRTENVYWWLFNPPQQLKTCFPKIDAVEEEDFTISSVDQLTLGLWLSQKAGVKFLPTNVSRVFPDLVLFEVSDCSVTTVSRNHFRDLSKLQLLYLIYNKIEHVASDAFVDLVSLEYLSLHHNKIQTLSADTFFSLKSLKSLYLYNNLIQHLDPEIFSSLVKVEVIWLNDNSIATLDEKIFESLTNLRVIYLSDNKLKEIPRNLFQNTLKLKYLWLSGNEIKFIDASMFDHLLNLSWVKLEGNLCLNKNYEKVDLDTMRSDLEQNCSAATEAACGVPRHAISLIVRGKKFPRGAFPWIVALMHTGWRPPKFFCAGTLISETFVISAAHCILDKHATEKFLARDILALFGAHDLSDSYESERTTLSPVKIFIHEDWNHLTTNYDADISLLKFQNGKIHFGDFIQPICLWNSKNDPKVTTGLVTGWGKSEDTTKLHENSPKMIPAPILTNERCWLDDPGLITISSERTFCAGLRNGSGVCQGDSGGGLFIEVDGVYHFRGIVSSSKVTDQGCDVSRNAVYTNVLKFSNWIKEKTQQTIEGR